MIIEKTCIDEYLKDRTSNEREDLKDALEKTVHYVLTNERTTKMILSAEKMMNMIGPEKYINLLQKSSRNGRCEERLDESTILYFETESSVYAKTLLENMVRSVFESPDTSEFSIELKSLRKIRVAFNSNETGVSTMLARLVRSNIETQDFKNTIIAECKTHATKTDLIKLSDTIKTLIMMDDTIKINKEEKTQ